MAAVFKDDYHIHLTSRPKWLALNLKEVWDYRDLVFLLAKRTFTVSYKQTILGPLWIIITPFISALAYTVVFGHIAGITTDGVPRVLFYLCNNAIWGMFASSVTSNAYIFTSNAGIFGKVYFPRLTVPLSNILVSAARFGIQMLVVMTFLIYYIPRGEVSPAWYLWPLIPVILLHLGIMGMSVGIIVSSLTTKYRDLSIVVSFGMTLWMYGTPIVYPLSQLEDGLLKTVILANPVTGPVEVFRLAMFGQATIEPVSLMISWLFTAAAAFLGVVIFNHVEKTFMDTV